MSRCTSIAPKKLRCADEIGERHGEMEYRGGKVLQRWRGSGGNVRLSHLLMSFLLALQHCRDKIFSCR